ncbi:MAG: glycosyltransferase [Bacteroidales bacterium]|nr:glycosyltransferase [Bacteroidales bacterium]
MNLTIIIPHYNNVALLGRCLHSIVASKLGDELQVVVVDDGSSDGQRQQAETLVAELSSKDSKLAVQLINNPKNQGASAARNKGLLSAQGRFVWFVDADDEIDTELMNLWWPKLKELDNNVELLHIGPMVDGKQHVTKHPSSITHHPTRLSDILVPRSHCLDHTTYWISREFLMNNPDIRYIENCKILEDSIFVLQLLEKAKDIVSADDCSLYIRHTDSPSVTAGAWSKDKSAAFMPFIQLFFSHLSQFKARHADLPHIEDLYHRYSYVYMRVLAVKGVPNALYRELFYKPIIQDTFIPRNFKERLLKNIVIHTLLSFVCRILRPSHD